MLAPALFSTPAALIGFDGVWSILLILLFLGVMWVWMLIECATKEPTEGSERLVWLLVILLANGVGADLLLRTTAGAHPRARALTIRTSRSRGNPPWR